MKADKRLAEIQERIKVIPGRETLLHGGAIAEDMQYLLDRIAELEKLAPDVRALELVVRFAYEPWHTVADPSGLDASIRKLRTTIKAIRKYREEGE